MAAARVFISFAIEDRNLRDLLVGQMRNSSTPFDWVDYSAKASWENSWKTNCRTRIRACRGVIGIITSNTPRANGQLWELRCAFDESVPTLLIYGTSARPHLPALLTNKRILTWSWNSLSAFLDRL
jgi:hypothetical protein